MRQVYVFASDGAYDLIHKLQIECNDFDRIGEAYLWIWKFGERSDQPVRTQNC